MIKVLHIGMSSHLGGIEVFINNLYKNINREQVQFDFVSFGSKPICYANEFKQMGAKIYNITSRRKNYLKNKFQLKKLIKENDYKIIHFHLNTLSYFYPIKLAKKLNVKIIVHSHNQWKDKNIKTKILHYINKIRFKRYKTTNLACSGIAGEWIFDGKSEFQVINNAIDIDKFTYSESKRRKIREEFNISEDCTVIGHVGAFRTQKNHTFLIDIFYEYLKHNSNAKLILVGEGKLKESMIHKVENLKIQDKVIFAGLRNDTDYLYSAFDYFLFPSLYEGLAIVLVEAEISGLKCFVTQNLSKESIITDNVIKISLNDTQSKWAEIMLEQENKYNRKIERTDNIKQFDVRNLSNSLHQIYKRLWEET